VLAWYRSALSARDGLDRERDLLVRERDALSVTLSTTADERDHERHLREVAEHQRNEAMARARRYLSERIKGASNDEISAAIADVFGSGLSLVPKADDTAAHRDDLLPFPVRTP
jgi:hypothetical protein